MSQTYPHVAGTRLHALIPIAGVLFKFLLFDAVWCSYTTFTPFSCWETYVTALTAILVLSDPYLLTRHIAAGILVMSVLDMWLVANLLYYRSYFTAIPLSSYLLAGNLRDFLPSVAASFRWCDALFPVSTVAANVWCGYRAGLRFLVRLPLSRRAYALLLVSLSVLLAIRFSAQGGFLRVYRELRESAHRHASGPVLYTLFGTLYADYADSQPLLTEEQAGEVRTWLVERPALHPLPGMEPRDNCVFILVESLESWVLDLTVEQQEITPHLNRLLKEPTTLYAPHVLTQVNGGRSIDAQLLMLAGLLPLQSGAYSCRFPLHTYHTLPKAMKELKGTRGYLLTVDKTKTWNQGAVARSFGIDTILSYPDFRMTEAFGKRRRLGDRAFFNQCKEKMEKGEIWPSGERVFIQLVTYSGHAPFQLPEALHSVRFSPRIPQLLADYMTVARYTDEAIGRFVEYLKSRPEYSRTLVVIAGDHEGLADRRTALCQTEAGRGIVSDKEFTPFIVLNSPVAMHYPHVMGQVDIYSTLLQLLGLESYRWHGMGQSILDADKPGVAITPARQVEGYVLPLSTDEQQRLWQSPIVSDRIIQFDLLKDL